MPSPSASLDDAVPGRLDRARYQLEFDEDFTGAVLDTGRWVSHYLPHWTTPERSAARYEVADGVLRLRIDADQPAWRLEDGPMRVSNIQTGTFSGPLGSPSGQMRHRPDLRVMTPQTTRRLYTPTFGLVEAELRANPDPTCMLAFWLVGFEADSPESSGELCVAEIFGSALGPHRVGINIGMKAHGDPRLYDDMEHVTVQLDATARHTYSAEWLPGQARFYVDDRLVRTVRQQLGYPLQLMVDFFEFPQATDRDPAGYPKTAEVNAVRGYRRP
jgi:Glycosyl hydrolases family 16